VSSLRRLAGALIILVACSHQFRAAQGVVFQTSVSPEADEDIAAPCSYELTLLDPARSIKGVWVVFDRGRDMLRYYGDPDVQAFAQRNDFALVLAFHCRAKSYEDMNVDPARGLGRALFAALQQFGTETGHPELGSAKVIVLSFSGPGTLVARFPGYAPDRVLAAIVSAAGQFDPLGLDTISLSKQAAAVPQLIIAGSGDGVSGTQRPYDYFRTHFDQGAPWAFLVQNSVGHCCIINAKGLVLEWLDAVVIRHVPPDAGMWGSITIAPSTIENCPSPRPALTPPSCQSVKDTWGGGNWRVTGATIARSRHTPPAGSLPAGWLPTSHFAKEWRAFITQPAHPITSMP
jgi:hypothetical protein